MIQTIKRKLGTEKLDPNFDNFKENLHRMLEDIRKSNHSVLKKSPFELHFGRKPNTEWSQDFQNVVNSDTSAQRLEHNLLTPDQIASRTTVVIVPRWCREEVPALRLPHVSTPCFLCRVMLLRVSLTKRYLILLGRPIYGHRIRETFRRMGANESFKSCRVVTQIWLIRSKKAFPAKHCVLRRIDQVLRPQELRQVPVVYRLYNPVACQKQVNWKPFSYPILAVLEYLGKL